MIELLRENSLLLLFVVTALGFTVGRISIFGIRLGSAAVLFVGLIFGAIDAELNVPNFVVQLGLVIFVYAIGLNNGANFFVALRQQGKQQISFILFFLTLPALMLAGVFFFVGLDAAAIAGVFSGVGTNTAALAGILDLIGTSADPANANNLIAETAVAFAIGYPMGVMGRILVITGMQSLWRIDFAAEAYSVRDVYPSAQELVDQAIEITNQVVTETTIRELRRQHNWDVVFGRLWRDGHVTIMSGDTQLQIGDVAFIAGEKEKVFAMAEVLGQPADNRIFTDYSIYTRRQFFVSNPAVVGQSVAALDLEEQYGALLSRVRRGDNDILANRDTILELGDRVRVLARRSNIDDLAALFGDSYEAVSRVNLLSFGYGVTFGLLLGMVSVTLPGGVGFQVGFAGGTLIVALILGAIRRTGSIVWTLPYSATQTLQEVGLILLLASIGVRSGNALESLVLGNTVLILLVAAFVVVLLNTVIALVVGHKLLKLPFALVAGMVASQPAVFSYTAERAKNHLPNIGFTMAIPVGLILKVVYAQLLFSLLSRL